MSNLSLSELIKNCGRKFATLSQDEKGNNWVCMFWSEVYTEEKVMKIGGRGKTPIEAVKNLYIFLNMK